MNLMPLGSLGAVETNGTVTFGLWLPWVSATDGNAVTVKIIHEALRGCWPSCASKNECPSSLRTRRKTIREFHELVRSGSGIDLLKDFSEVAREELRAFTTL